jgi:hypothetical protein
MKTTLEKVFETLNKVELKSEKIELQSAQAMLNDALKLKKLMDQYSKDLDNAEVSIKFSVTNLKGIVNSIERAQKKTEQLAQALGVKVNSIKKYNQIENMKNLIEKRIKKYK